MPNLELGVGLNDLPVLGGSVDLVRELNRLNPHYFPATAVLPTIRNNSWTGATISVNGASHIIDATGAPLANKVIEIGEPWPSSTDIMPSWCLNVGTTELSCYMDLLETGTPAGDAFIGLEIGTINANPPFPAAPSAPCLQLRLSRVANKVQLYSAVGDGVTPATIVDDTVFGSIPYEYKLRLRFVPGKKAEAFIYNTKLCEITDPAKLPLFLGSQKARMGLIVSSGSSAWGPKMVATNPVLLQIGA